MRKSIQIAFICQILFLGFLCQIQAKGNAGAAGAFLKFGVGAESLGRGNSFVAVTQDATASYWNPAGLAFAKNPEVSFMQANMSLDRKYNFVGFVKPLKKYSLGINYIRFGVDNIPETRDVNDSRHFNDNNTNGVADAGEYFDANANGMPDDPVLTTTVDRPGSTLPSQAGVDFLDKNGNGIYDNGTDILLGDVKIFSYFEDMESALTLSYAKKIREKSAFGINLKYLKHELFSVSATGFGFDLGFLHEVSEKTRLGLSIRDIGSYIKFDNTNGTREEFPLQTTFGVLHNFGDKLNASVDLYKVEDLDLAARLGLEYWLNNNAAFRLGSDDGEVAFGASFKKNNWKFDYAYTDRELGVSQRISAARSF
ncbi:DUF5723 family protein [Candidatus Riflebacteria bacterium]